MGTVPNYRSFYEEKGGGFQEQHNHGSNLVHALHHLSTVVGKNTRERPNNMSVPPVTAQIAREKNVVRRQKQKLANNLEVTGDDMRTAAHEVQHNLEKARDEIHHGKSDVDTWAVQHTLEETGSGMQEALPPTMPAVSVLDALGPCWGSLCATSKSARFAWAQGGGEISGWIEFVREGVITACSGEGTWYLLNIDSKVIVVDIGQYRCDTTSEL